MPRIFNTFCIAIALLIITILTGCGTHATKGAVQGGSMGAISGAVGGMVTALVFGGNVADSAARGAIYGGAVGATSGAISGSQKDAQVKQQQEAELAKLKSAIGNDAYEGLGALAVCDYQTSLDKAAKAKHNDNADYALAGLWLEILSYADKRNEQKARDLFPALIEKDNKIKSATQAEDTMRKALNSLMDIREEYNKSRVCSSS